MTSETEAAAKDQQRLKGDTSIPQGGGESGKQDTTTAPAKGGSRAPDGDSDPNLKPAKPGDS
ncbi:hypothetical protein [Skermanella pratensis]|uniref:hypothetical protein n=1 Tax=Skermanella pratensis TaxID=2233999 RepID=UPI001300CFE8|nr:hypothetical protein [Skermanella pratensis]